jgi:hypothetical protein
VQQPLVLESVTVTILVTWTLITVASASRNHRP